MSRTSRFLAVITSALVVQMFFGSCKDELLPLTVSKAKGVIQNKYNQPIAGAEVSVYKESLMAKSITNDLGFFSLAFSDHFPDTYRLEASADGYQTNSQTFTLEPEQTLDIVLTLEAGDPSLHVIDSIIHFSQDGGKQEVIVKCNYAWQVESASEWVTFEPKSGIGIGKLTFEVAPNPTTTNRMDSVKLVTGNISQIVYVHQNDPLQLLSYEWRLENIEENTADSVILYFNKAVSVESIEDISPNSGCNQLFDWEYSSDQKRVSFTSRCMVMGGTYTFRFNVTDDESGSLEKDLKVPFYTKKLELPGDLMDMYLSEDNQILWASIHEPKLIVGISMDSLAIQHQYPVDCNPRHLSFNAYNGYLYFTCTNNGYGPGTLPLFKKLDLNTGTIVETVDVLPLALDHPQSPYVGPEKFAFCANGYGAVHVSNRSGNDKTKIIDSALGDSIYYHPVYNDPTPGIPSYFSNTSGIFLHPDKQKIILSRHFDNGLSIIDGLTQDLSEFVPPLPNGGNSNFIAMNRLNGDIYCAYLYQQFITDLEGNLSSLSYLDTRGLWDHIGCDFGYREDNDKIIYYSNNAYFRVLDYENSQTLFSTPNIGRFNDLLATTDGKYIILNVRPGPSENVVYFFEADIFY